MAKNKYAVPTIVFITGLLMIGSSWLIDKFITSGFLLRVNSDTFGVGLALTIGGFFWLIFKRKI